MKNDKPNQMTVDQLDYVKKEIIRTYLYLVSFTSFDPEVVEVMKLSALYNVQRKYDTGEPW